MTDTASSATETVKSTARKATTTAKRSTRKAAGTVKDTTKEAAESVKDSTAEAAGTVKKTAKKTVGGARATKKAKAGLVKDARKIAAGAGAMDSAAVAIAEAEALHYQVEVNKRALSVNALTKTLNERWDNGWRLAHILEQRGNTVLVFEKRS